MTRVYLVPAAEVGPELLADGEIVRLAYALGAWVNSHPGPDWSQGHYHVSAVPRGTLPPRGGEWDWLIWLKEHSPELGVLGFHSVDGAGAPYAELFVADTLAAGQPLSVAASHELCELLVNRFVNAYVVAQGGAGPGAYMLEACDPCEGASYPYQLLGQQSVLVSDYCLPHYFRSGTAGPYDRLGLVPAPLTPMRGGRQAHFAISGPLTEQVGAARGVQRGGAGHA